MASNSTLFPGVWDISAVARTVGVAGLNRWQACISSANNSYPIIGPGAGDADFDMVANGVSAHPTESIPAVRVSISATTTHYLVGSPAGATATASGRISAVRVA